MKRLGNGGMLLELRRQKKVPTGLILVSFVGRLSADNFVLYATPGRPYDWRLIKELRVCAFIDDGLGSGADLAPIAEHATHGEAHVWHVGRARGAWIYPNRCIDESGRVVTRPGVDHITWTGWQTDRFAQAAQRLNNNYYVGEDGNATGFGYL